MPTLAHSRPTAASTYPTPTAWITPVPTSSSKIATSSDGDDDIVAKPASTACTNITVTGNTIGAGHGICIGGGSAKGVSNFNLSNCTFTGTTYGLRIKAQDATGGDAGGGTATPVNGVTCRGITMTNVTHPIVIDSFYDGSDNFPTSPTQTTKYPTAAMAKDGTTPVFENISFVGVTVTGASDAGLIYGLNTSPNSLSGLTFSGVSISAQSHMNLWYASNVDFSGLTVNVPSSDKYAKASPVNGVYAADLINVLWCRSRRRRRCVFGVSQP